MEQWYEAYYAAEKRLGDYARNYAERIRLDLGDDLITSGEAMSTAYGAVWAVAFEGLCGRVETSERGLLAITISRALIKLLRTELRHTSPRALVVREYTQRLEDLEREIAKMMIASTPMSREEEARHRRGLKEEFDAKLAHAAHREYLEDHEQAALPAHERSLADKAICRINADELITRILDHPYMAEQDGQENRRRYAFLLLLKYEGDDVDGFEWTHREWTLNTGRVLLSGVRKFLRNEFPELRELAG